MGTRYQIGRNLNSVPVHVHFTCTLNKKNNFLPIRYLTPMTSSNHTALLHIRLFANDRLISSFVLLISPPLCQCPRHTPPSRTSYKNYCTFFSLGIRHKIRRNITLVSVSIHFTCVQDMKLSCFRLVT